MIKYEWRDHLEPRRVRRSSPKCWPGRPPYDAEPEYNTIDFADVTSHVWAHP